MATADVEKVKEFLTCGICHELYTDPCTLRCDHTFCRKCVTSYIQTRPDAVQSKTIPCAFCRQNTKVPSPSLPKEEWAWQIKPSIIIQGLTDTLEHGKKPDRTSSQSCFVCEQLGETTPATFWCSECEVTLCARCVNMHRANPASRNHELFDLSAEVKVKKKKRMVACQEHRDDQVKYLCKDCNRPLCQSCCVVYHRKCDSVVTLESEMSRMKSELHTRGLAIQNDLNEKTKKIDKWKSKIKKIQRDKVSVKKKIQSYSEKIIIVLKDKERALIEEVDGIAEKQIMELKADVKLAEIELQMFKQHREFLDQTLVSESEMDLYEACQAWESGNEEDTAPKTDKSERKQIHSIRFAPEADTNKRTLDDLKLGKLDITYTQGEHNALSSMLLYKTVDFKLETEGKSPLLSEVIVLVVGETLTLVTSDKNNKCLKSAYTRDDHQRFSKLDFDNFPHGISQLSHNRVLVAVPRSLQIVTALVTPDLELEKSITTEKEYFSIAVLNASSFAASSYSSIDILDMAGNIIRSVTGQKDVELFTYPNYMCVNSIGHVLVSDFGKGSVTCLTSEGDVVWRYAPTGDETLEYVSGITSTSTGDILVADRNTHTIMQLAAPGTFVRELIGRDDGINNRNENLITSNSV
ncbi:tripartite motif-containing protein 42-like isoform X2 [Haliotis rubra]|uniref:tripartite motif-containing protein 42-like isoform X2 n=1 Tax=Haliotis rubra TaxID=36100 RepID=UPI001EE521F0|nr:tripartite motif-containing protein 42-like isoform X2 [Haliotis rubra]